MPSRPDPGLPLPHCSAVFNLFTGTRWAKTRYPCSTIVQILRGIAQGVSTRCLVETPDLDRRHALARDATAHLCADLSREIQATTRSYSNDSSVD